MPQFSLRALLIAMLAVSFLLAILFAFPLLLIVYLTVLLVLMLPGATLAGVVYLRRRWQAFCVTALFWQVSLLWMCMLRGDRFLDEADEMMRVLLGMNILPLPDHFSLRVSPLVIIAGTLLAGLPGLLVYRLAVYLGHQEAGE